MLADRVEDDVVGLAVLREVLLEVVDDLVGPERAHHLDVLRVAHGGDVGAEVLRELHRRRSDRSRRAIDENAATLERAGLPQARERDDRSVADRCRLLERQTRGHVRERALLPDADELRVRTRPHSEDTIAHGELLHGRADCLHLAGELHADDPSLRSEEAGEDAREERLRGAMAAVGPRDRRCVHFHEDFVLLGCRPRDVGDAQNLRRAVLVVNDRSHDFLSSRWNRWIGPPWLHARPAR